MVSNSIHVVANDRIDFLNDFFLMTNLRKKVQPSLSSCEKDPIYTCISTEIVGFSGLLS